MKRMHECYQREGIEFRSPPEVVLKETQTADGPRPSATRITTPG